MYLICWQLTSSECMYLISWQLTAACRQFTSSECAYFICWQLTSSDCVYFICWQLTAICWQLTSNEYVYFICLQLTAICWQLRSSAHVYFICWQLTAVCWKLTSSECAFNLLTVDSSLLTVEKQWVHVIHLFLILVELCFTGPIKSSTFCWSLLCNFSFFHIGTGFLSAKEFYLSPMIPNTICPINKPPKSNNQCWLSNSQSDNYVIFERQSHITINLTDL